MALTLSFAMIDHYEQFRKIDSDEFGRSLIDTLAV
jgi:hypothetical protein